MPSLPTKAKTWEFDANTVVGSGLELTTHRNQMLAMKNSMIDGVTFTRPWVLKGSSNATTSNMSGTDLWGVIGDLNWDATPGNPHSWVVLEQPGIQFPGADNPLQVLMSLSLGSGNAATNRTFVLSPRNGFGAANGGTDGSASSDPTATDQWSPFFGSTWISHSANVVQTVMMSDDGKITRILIGTGSSRLTGWLSFEVPKNPNPIWDQPFFFIAKPGLGGTDIGLVNLWGNSTAGANLKFQHGLMTGLDGVPDGAGFAREYLCRVGTTINFMSGPTEVVRRPAGQIVHDVSGGFNITPAAIYVRQGDPNQATTSRGARGLHWCEIEDFYFIGEDTSPGDSLPASGTTKQWWCLGDIIVPGPADSATDISL